MGGSVPAVKANLYVEDFKEEALVSAPCTFKIGKRFVDDVSRQSLFKRLSVFICIKAQKNPHLKIKATAVLPYVKGLSQTLCRCLQQQGIRPDFRSDTTFKSHMMRPK